MEGMSINVIKMSNRPQHYRLKKADNLNVLLIDSSELILSRIKDLLLDFSFIDLVETSTDIKNIIHVIRKLSPDVIIIDISTYDKNGIETIQTIKEHFPLIKIIMQTNLSEQYYNYYKWLFEQVGADYFIDKSNEFDLLHDILKEINENRKED